MEGESLLRIPARSRARIWRQLMFIVLGLAAPAVWVGAIRVAEPSDGTFLPPSPGQSIVRIDQVYAAGSELKPGDRVLAIQGRRIEDYLTGQAPRLAPNVGDILTYAIERNGRPQEVSVKISAYPFFGALKRAWTLLLVVASVLILFAGVFVVRRDDPATLPMLLVGLSLPWIIPEYPLGPQVLDIVRQGGLVGYIGADLAACVFWGAMCHVALTFPYPLYGPRSRRWLIPAGYSLPFVLYGVGLLWRLPSANGLIARLFALILISSIAAVVVPVLLGTRIIVSFIRTKDQQTRKSLRAVLISVVAFFAGYSLLGQIPGAVRGAPLVSYQWLILGALGIPVTMTAAILRYNLFDIQLVMTRSLIVGGLTALVGAVYAAAVLAVPRLQLKPIPTLGAMLIGSAAAAGALLVRGRLTRWVTSVVYGNRNNPRVVVDRLAQLDTATAADELVPEVVYALTEVLRIPYARLELRGPDGEIELEAQVGARSGPSIVVPIGSDFEVLGELELDAGRGREPFGPADRRLLIDISRHLTDACRTVLLARYLQRSRQRIIIAREEERRRLRRDLHDGVGPSLAAMAMQLEMARTNLGSRPALVKGSVERAASTIKSLIEDVNGIVDELRPSALDHFSLAGAIESGVAGLVSADGKGLDVPVRCVGDLTALPPVVEVTVLRIAIEAVHNAIRYSGGSRCEVELRRDDTLLLLTVTDDGGGLSTEVRGTGVGLASMRERAAEVGGVCSIDNRSDASGVIVQLRVPLAPVRSG
jgi:two-component system NarL family sensor kinase